MPRWASKVDRNHKAVVDTLRACGWRVKDTSRVGQGFPDLVIAKGGRTMLAEVKAPTGAILSLQHAFLIDWPGEWIILRSVEDVLALNQSGQATIQPTRGGSAVSPGDSA
jgi:hypothetical protein